MNENYCLELLTLVDITQTNVVGKIDNKERYQQINLETVLQVLQLRGQIIGVDMFDVMANQSLKKYNFGIDFSGKAPIWKLHVFYDRPKIFDDGDYKFMSLYKDFTNVPMITGLNEGVSFSSKTFECIDKNTTNLYCIDVP